MLWIKTGAKFRMEAKQTFGKIYIMGYITRVTVLYSKKYASKFTFAICVSEEPEDASGDISDMEVVEVDP